MSRHNAPAVYRRQVTYHTEIGGYDIVFDAPRPTTASGANWTMVVRDVNASLSSTLVFGEDDDYSWTWEPQDYDHEMQQWDAHSCGGQLLLDFVNQHLIPLNIDP